MRVAPARLTALLTAAALAATLAACGGGGGETATTAASTAGGSTGTAASAGGPNAGSQATAGGEAKPSAKHQSGSSQSQPHNKHQSQSQGHGDSGGGGVAGDTSASFTPPAHHDSGGGATQFQRKGADNSIQEFGSEASGSELEAAATALHGYLDARAAGAWRDACSYMVAGVAASLSQLSGGEGGETSCPEVLASLSGGLPPSSLREAAVADAGALRLEGERAFLLFQGAHDTDYFMPMAQEAGAWKVAALAPSALS